MTRPRWFRFRSPAAGAALTTLAAVMRLAAALPPGPAGIDGIALPLVLAPLAWAALFFHACLDRSLRRVGVVALALHHGAHPAPVA